MNDHNDHNDQHQPRRMTRGAPREISRDDLVELPLQRYEGIVHRVATPDEVAAAMADIRQEHVVGFDTETRPAFRKGESHLPAIAQVATARAVYIFTLSAVEVHSALAEMLEAPGIAKAGVALAHDLHTLKQRFEFTEQGVLDLGQVARSGGSKQTGVRNLAGMFLGYRIPKGASTSNWAAPQLTHAQIIYAATDAWVCRELYLHFESKDWIRR
jgi:ribonuclease D